MKCLLYHRYKLFLFILGWQWLTIDQEVFQNLHFKKFYQYDFTSMFV